MEKKCRSCDAVLSPNFRGVVCNVCFEKWKQKKIADGTWDDSRSKKRDNYRSR